ncbi:MAG: endo alpha-1,4 polygalactosaminidase [Flavobacteriales bacterium]|nr:endo alpha-1,4 polygalactosaminidase [Flavobacteriales bacterium]
MLAIDGIGLEELFYSGGFSLDVERLAFAQELGKTKTIMVSEFVSSNANVVDAIQRNIEEGFLSFLRVGTNYDYLQIPDSVNAETANSISSLSDAANFLYLISTDNYTSKQLMINAIAATNYDVVLIDLFFDGVAFSAPEIQQLKTKANGGKRLVIAYMNIGAAESFRYYWKDNWKQHKPKWLKKKYEGFEDEIWVKFWKKEWQDIIYGNDNSYSKKILDAGFDGVHLDNVEAYYFLYFD